METIIKKRINHDSMWMKGTFPSGGNFKFTVLRYGTKLEVAFSNDDNELDRQMKVFSDWLKRNHTTTYGQLFNDLESLCEECNSGKQLITKMEE